MYVAGNTDTSLPACMLPPVTTALLLRLEIPSSCRLPLPQQPSATPAAPMLSLTSCPSASHKSSSGMHPRMNPPGGARAQPPSFPAPFPMLLSLTCFRLASLKSNYAITQAHAQPYAQPYLLPLGVIQEQLWDAPRDELHCRPRVLSCKKAKNTAKQGGGVCILYHSRVYRQD